MREDGRSGTYSAYGFANAFGLAGERIRVGARRVAVQDERIGECGCLVAALLVGER
ncbi:hypothetical protein D3C87_1826610 [compost metagenome]